MKGNNKMSSGLFSVDIKPDWESLIRCICRQGTPQRLHFIELFLDDEIKTAVCDKYIPLEGLSKSDKDFDLKREIAVHRFLGYDVFRVASAVGIFPSNIIKAADTTAIEDQQRSVREWSEEHIGPIQSWADFEKYLWPKVSDVNFKSLEWMEKNMPDDMGCYDLTGHILETVEMLLGYETLCLKLYDEPELIDAILEKVGEFYIEYTQAICDFSCVKLAWGSDDMGFKTSTLVSAEVLREKILPWHKRCAEVAHKNGKPYLMHNCGKLDEIMDDLIDDVKIDAKHSFEDTIMPVTEAKKRYGDRIAILGGIDIDFLCRSSEQAIRKRVRDTLEICTVNNGYCLGTGNTVANYIPLNNYLTMLDEGRKYITT